jgi:hypothetical protein
MQHPRHRAQGDDGEVVGVHPVAMHHHDPQPDVVTAGLRYLNASQAALDNLAKAMERERALGTDANGQRVVRHAADLARERRERTSAPGLAPIGNDGSRFSSGRRRTPSAAPWGARRVTEALRHLR